MVIKKIKVVEKIFIIILLIYVITSNFTVAFASEGDSLITQIQSDIASFKSAADKNGGEINLDEVTKPFIGLGQVLTMIGAGVMIAVTTYMGIKYLTAGPEAQAKLKEQLIGVGVAGIVIFGAYFIWQIVINVASTF